MINLLSTFATILSLWLMGSIAHPADISDPDKTIQLIIDLQKIEDDDKRHDQAKVICDLIEKEIKTIDKKRALSSLEKYLDDKDDGVVFWVALSIGKFGMDAKYLLPKLKALLVIKEKLPGSKTSASSIRQAISRIGKRSKID